MWPLIWILLLVCGIKNVYAQNITMEISPESPIIGSQFNLTCHYDFELLNQEPPDEFYINNSTNLPYKCIYTPTNQSDQSNGDSCVSASTNSSVSLTMIKKAKKEDNGTWFCKAEGLMNKNVSVIIRYPPDITLVLAVGDEIRIGSTVNLSCIVDSFPKSNITWSVNGKPENNAKQDLQIGNVSCLDTGTYKAVCSATNGVGSKTAKEEINVICPPRVHSKHTPQTQLLAPLASSVKFTATVMAHPTPTFTWCHLLTDRTKMPITDYRMTESDQTSKLTSSLDIINIEEHDYGNYMLYVKNTEGHISITFTLKKADDNKLGTGIGIGFTVGVLVVGIILVVAFLIWKKFSQGKSLRQMFQFKGKSSIRRNSDVDNTPTTRKHSTTHSTSVQITKTPDQTYEGLNTDQPRVNPTYEGLLPQGPVQNLHDEQEIYENQVVR